MILLVTGGRNYCEPANIKQALDSFNSNTPITLLVHGDAKGVDRIAGRWAAENGIHPCAIPALWGFYNMRAGGTRNSAMLNLPIDYCIAFPGNTGTADMVKQCENKSIIVWKPYG